jgi:peptide/nickel transport system substrate-binding protein
MVHSTNRQEMSEALQAGTAPVADVFVPPESSAYQVLEAQGFNRYPFDLSRARQLMGEAGWNRGGDGMFRDQGGQPLTVDIAATGQGSNVQEIETVASQWQMAGFTASPVPIPPRDANFDERRATVRGGFLWPWTPSLAAPQNLVSSQSPAERTSWKGRNYGSYSNPAYDALYERYTTTIEPAARDRITADLMKLLAEEVPLVPIYFYGTGVIARKGVSGPGMISPLQTASAWNIESWEIR